MTAIPDQIEELKQKIEEIPAGSLTTKQVSELEAILETKSKMDGFFGGVGWIGRNLRSLVLWAMGIYGGWEVYLKYLEMRGL